MKAKLISIVTIIAVLTTYAANAEIRGVNVLSEEYKAYGNIGVWIDYFESGPEPVSGGCEYWGEPGNGLTYSTAWSSASSLELHTWAGNTDKSNGKITAGASYLLTFQPLGSELDLQCFFIGYAQDYHYCELYNLTDSMIMFQGNYTTEGYSCALEPQHTYEFYVVTEVYISTNTDAADSDFYGNLSVTPEPASAMIMILGATIMSLRRRKC